MELIDRLKAQAKARRDAAIRAAELDYAHAKKEIRAVERRLLRECPQARAKKPLRAESSIAIAERILAERGPLTLLELAVAVADAGYVSKRGPASLKGTLRVSMLRHRERFWCEGGVWGVATLRVGGQYDGANGG
ncbi:hypothetical protein [Botrimarina sp.]|uniref:hypothetical protein n=1 Tax=Botrimarina sp. TaxID=2795802 RepID=UPI0032F06824